MTQLQFQESLQPENSDPALMSTGPSGLLLGIGQSGPQTVRLFRTQPTRVYLAVPEYLNWLIAFRSMCIGAHLSVLAADHRRWLGLADAVRSCGGTIDVARSVDSLPGQGRPFRPSLIIDELGLIEPTARLGAWQAVLKVGDPEDSGAISELRSCELAVLTPVSGKGAENLRRAYALTQSQLRAVTPLADGEIVLASVRRIVKARVAPSATEYRLLFGG